MSYAPLAQLVEHLTLNQGVQGSSPWWCTISGPLVKRLRHRPLTAKTGVRFSYGSPRPFRDIQQVYKQLWFVLQFIVGVYYAEGPPVPIPNTVVKLTRAENSWRAASRENRSTPTSFQPLTYVGGLFYLFLCIFIIMTIPFNFVKNNAIWFVWNELLQIKLGNALYDFFRWSKSLTVIISDKNTYKT